MSSYASLLLNRDGIPRGAAALDSDVLGSAAGYVPLGWMALFRSADLRLIPAASEAR